MKFVELVVLKSNRKTIDGDEGTVVFVNINHIIELRDDYLEVVVQFGDEVNLYEVEENSYDAAYKAIVDHDLLLGK